MPHTTMGTLLGFDYGTHRIGVAVGQTITATATALTTLNAVQQRPDWEQISTLIEAWQPQALIVGLPFNMDDTETEVASRARRFSRQLEGRYHLPVHLVDERLTSLEATRQLGGKPKQEGKIDALAAKLILETWLSEHT